MQSGWTDRTLSLGYSLRASPSIWGSQGDETLLTGGDKFPLCGGSGPAAVKQAMSAAPLHNRQKGFYPPYLLVPKKTGEFRPILDLCLLKVLCLQNVHHANHQAVTWTGSAEQLFHHHRLKGGYFYVKHRWSPLSTDLVAPAPLAEEGPG